VARARARRVPHHGPRGKPVVRRPEPTHHRGHESDSGPARTGQAINLPVRSTSLDVAEVSWVGPPQIGGCTAAAMR